MKTRSNTTFLNILFIVVFLFLFLQLTHPETYFIDFQNGNDSNSGDSTASPWETIPGTRNTGNTGWESSDWGSGTFNSGSKVPGDTTFKLKSGTTHDSTNGGIILIDKTYYSDASAANPIVLEVDTTWSTGAVVFDGTGISAGIALVLIQMHGIKVDGKVSGGIVIRDAQKAGLEIKEKPGSGDPINDSVLQYIKFFNNGTDYSSGNEGIGDGQLNVRKADGLTVDYCEFDGNGLHNNGVLLGDSSTKLVTNGTVSNSSSYNHVGNVPPDDCGIGFKAQNGQITFTNVQSYNNLKGFDLGEQNGPNVDITYKIVNSIARNNKWGINFSGANDPAYSGSINWYIINTIVRDNTKFGSNIYAGPYNLYMVHNIYDNNGTGGSNANYGNIKVGPNVSPDDSSRMTAHLYNNIFYKPSADYNYVLHEYIKNTSGFDLDSDYNCWRQRASENFAMWDYSNATQQVIFTYAEGPGIGVGSDWYDWYDYNTTPPSNGSTSHYQSDPNSVTTEPPFIDIGNHDYRLNGSFAGTDLSVMALFVPEMGLDRSGNPRSFWDMGPYESGIVPSEMESPTGLRLK